MTVSTVYQMTAGDTCYVQATVTGGTKVVDMTNSQANCWFSGNLLS